jgi:GT2 family glycosyltransferase
MPVEFVVVDNGSNGQTVEVLKRLSAVPQLPLKLILNIGNKGFGPGNNQGVEASMGSVLIITQPDVILKEDVAEKAREANDYFLYGPQLNDYDTGWNRFGTTIVPYLNGHFLVCTRKTWDVIGGFDSRYYPTDFEDVDLSYTAVQKGVELVQTPYNVMHLSSGSWSLRSDRLQVTRNNRKVFAQKWGLPCE